MDAEDVGYLIGEILCIIPPQISIPLVAIGLTGFGAYYFGVEVPNKKLSEHAAKVFQPEGFAFDGGNVKRHVKDVDGIEGSLISLLLQKDGAFYEAVAFCPKATAISCSARQQPTPAR